MSKSKRNGGYVLVDFDGVKIDVTLIDTNQTPNNPVFEPIRSAIKHNKPILLSNLILPTPLGEFVITPIPVAYMAKKDLDGDPTEITLIASAVVAGNVFSFNVTTDGDGVDYVTLTT